MEALIKIARSLQDLILAIANEGGVADGNQQRAFEIALCGYKKGGVIPQFMLVPVYQQERRINIEPQLEHLNSRFNELMQLSHLGNYEYLEGLYPDTKQRNAIVEALYQFTNSTGDSPMAFVEFNERDFPTQIYQVRKLEPVVRDKHFSGSSGRENFGADHLDLEEVENKNVIEGEIQTSSFSPTTVTFNQKVYHFRYPLRCRLEVHDGYCLIHSELLDLTGTGETFDAARKSFSQEFDFAFHRLNQLPKDQLTNRLNLIKANLNFLVTKIE